MEQITLRDNYEEKCPLCGSESFVTDGDIIICMNCNWSNNLAMFDDLPEWGEPLDLGFSHDFEGSIEIDEDFIF